MKAAGLGFILRSLAAVNGGLYHVGALHYRLLVLDASGDWERWGVIGRGAAVLAWEHRRSRR